MTKLEQRALLLRRARLKKQANQTSNVQDKAKKFSTEWRNSIVVRALSA
ncbi:hypothetical protein [Proteus terrae]|nr:hypothetical protein [Proteus terrae]